MVLQHWRRVEKSVTRLPGRADHEFTPNSATNAVLLQGLGAENTPRTYPISALRVFKLTWSISFPFDSIFTSLPPETPFSLISPLFFLIWIQEPLGGHYPVTNPSVQRDGSPAQCCQPTRSIIPFSNPSIPYLSIPHPQTPHSTSPYPSVPEPLPFPSV